jgi:hypothetical protein
MNFEQDSHTERVAQDEIEFAEQCEGLLARMGAELDVAMGMTPGWAEFLRNQVVVGGPGRPDRAQLVIGLVAIMRFWDNCAMLPDWFGRSRQAAIYRMMTLQLNRMGVPQGGVLTAEGSRAWQLVLRKVLRFYQYFEGWSTGSRALFPFDQLADLTRRFVLRGHEGDTGSYAEAHKLHMAGINDTMLQMWEMMRKKGRKLLKPPHRVTWDAFCAWPASTAYRGMEKTLPREWLAAAGRLDNLMGKARRPPRRSSPKKRERAPVEPEQDTEAATWGSSSLKMVRTATGQRAPSLSTSQSSKLFAVETSAIEPGGDDEMLWSGVRPEAWSDLAYLCELPLQHLSAVTETWPLPLQHAMRPVLSSKHADVVKRVFRDCGRRRGGDEVLKKRMRHYFRDTMGSLFGVALFCYKDRPSEVGVAVGRVMRLFLRAASRHYGTEEVPCPGDDEEVLGDGGVGEVGALSVPALPQPAGRGTMPMDTRDLASWDEGGLNFDLNWAAQLDSDEWEDEELWGSSIDSGDQPVAMAEDRAGEEDPNWDDSPAGRTASAGSAEHAGPAGVGEAKSGSAKSSPVSAEELYLSQGAGLEERRAQACRQLGMSARVMEAEALTVAMQGTGSKVVRQLVGALDTSGSSVATPTPPEMRYGPGARPGFDHMWLRPGDVLGPADGPARASEGRRGDRTGAGTPTMDMMGAVRGVAALGLAPALVDATMASPENRSAALRVSADEGSMTSEAGWPQRTRPGL